MPRASDYLAEGRLYHLTHRCHNRSYFLRFARDRDSYRDWLREGVRRHGVAVYGYTVTSNHTHVVAEVDSREAVSALMHLAAGSTAKQYNLRKGHLGSVWEHPYQCTAIEDGQHLRNCLCYVDLNMVRAGVVPHPGQWRWCGYDELSGKRVRYRIIDQDRLLERLDIGGMEAFRRYYTEAIETRLARGVLSREAHWTDALAVGSRAFVEDICAGQERRCSFEMSEVAGPGGEAWMVKETREAYGPD